MDVVAAAVAQAATPFALIGYLGVGVYAGRVWEAVKLGLLWGLAIQVFAVATGRISLLRVEALAVNTGLKLGGAVLITLGVFYLARLVRRR